MNRKSLSYDALRSVLGHMEANKRIQISIACPSLRNVEKTIPLKIDHLSFSCDYAVQINENLFSFGIIRQYREGTPPKPIQSVNDRGGLSCDLDEWGFDKPSYRLTEAPGDIRFGDEQEEIDEDTDEDRLEIERGMHAFRESEEDDSYDRLYAECQLLPFHCRDNNVKPAHDCFVQLNLTAGEFQFTPKPIQKVPYTKKLHEVMKGFMTFIFGGRSCPIQVNCLEIDWYKRIVRLPVGVKFSVHELRSLTKISDVSKFLLPVLDESCLPIKHINQQNLIDLNDPIVANAEEVTFHDIFDENLFEFIRNLPHLKVNFISTYYDVHNEGEFIEFIKNLLESDKKVGTTYQLGVRNTQRVPAIFSKIENGLLKREIIGTGNLIIQNESSKEVQILYEKDVDNTFFGETESFCVLKIQVLGNRQEANY